MAIAAAANQAHVEPGEDEGCGITTAAGDELDTSGAASTRGGYSSTSLTLNALKKSSAIFEAAASIKRDPIWANLPPICARARYFSLVCAPASSSSTSADPFPNPA